ncbi:MAG: hypothetical protein FJ246_00125 [Nitrospira sp.]|nr:hypothetical protein [Nitrospira sp.]
MKYLLAAIAGIWMADGLALLVAPRQVIARVREVLDLSSAMLRWEGVAICLGIILLLGSRGLHYELLWTVTGTAMVVKGLFLAVGPQEWKTGALTWCLHREDVDYRFWGLGLCTLALLLLNALGWLGVQ